MSDTENESENKNDILIDPLELFIYNESDSIIDLHQDLKSRFPYFFKDTSLPLYTFILNHITNNLPVKNNYDINYFINEYNKEIQVTLDTVNAFLVNRKKSFKKIDIKNWQAFCYENF